MEQPRPGNTARRPLIIERPDLQSRPQRLVSMLLTVFFWVLWAYLWMPLLALLGWALGLSLYFEEMVVRDGHGIVRDVLGWYALAVGLIAGTLVGWALYNYFRFRRNERRSSSPAVTLADVAAHVGVGVAELARWQRADLLYVTHNAHGRIEAVKAFPAVPLRRYA